MMGVRVRRRQMVASRAVASRAVGDVADRSSHDRMIPNQSPVRLS